VNIVKRLRLNAHKTIAATAEALGVSPDTVARMEKGRSKVGLEEIRILAEFFECKETDFLSYNASNPPHPREKEEVTS